MEGRKIIEFRRALGLSQRDLAELLEVAVSTVSRWENGHNKPHRWVRQRLVRMQKERKAS